MTKLLSDLLAAILAFFRHAPTAPAPIPAPVVEPAHIAPAPVPTPQPAPVAPVAPVPVKLVAPVEKPGVAATATPPLAAGQPAAASAPIITPAGFIAAIGSAARTSMAKTKIPASFTVAEAALESGWGAHCPGHNLFGVKADASWHGPTTMQMTHEVVGGKTETIVAKFRAYSDWLGSIEDHAQFLLDNPRYKAAFTTTDGEKFAAAVARAGYATDPSYAAKICSIIEAHHLSTLDTEAA